MNANELANLIGMCGDGGYNQDAANMLRQQQAEIAEFKHMNRNWQISENILLLELEKLQHCELTDDEIRKIALDCDAYENDGGLITDDICIDKFARAILKKAQE